MVCLRLSVYQLHFVLHLRQGNTEIYLNVDFASVVNWVVSVCRWNLTICG